MLKLYVAHKQIWLLLVTFFCLISIIMLYPTNMVLKSLITHENYFSVEVPKLIGTLMKFMNLDYNEKFVTVVQMFRSIDFCLILG